MRFLTAGESHGPSLTAILEGMPAGLSIDRDKLNLHLARRQKGYGSGGRMRIEKDAVHITGGVMNGKTTGGPISLIIPNIDYRNWYDRDIPPMTVPRPGHADLTGAIKYSYSDLRLSLERASARETAARVAVGALCSQFLELFGIKVGCYVVRIGDIEANILEEMPYVQRFQEAELNELRCPNPEAAEAMRNRIGEIMQQKDTLGGIFEVVALGIPPGLGSYVHWDLRLDSLLMWSVGSIHAIKGVEIGPAFDNASKVGSEVHDEIFVDEAENLVRRTNNAGGFEGGITTGQPIVIRAAMKPISTVLNPRRSVDLATGEAAETIYERSDFCAVPRAAVVGEAMVAFTLANSLLEKTGGDSIDEVGERVTRLRRANLQDIDLDNTTWRFGFDVK
ncbi:MAG: chorismate synthase [Candidatus Promineifilaceae bacterium]